MKRTSMILATALVAFLLFGYLAAIRVAMNAGVDVAGADRLVVRHKVSLIEGLMPVTCSHVTPFKTASRPGRRQAGR